MTPMNQGQARPNFPVAEVRCVAVVLLAAGSAPW